MKMVIYLYIGATSLSNIFVVHRNILKQLNAKKIYKINREIVLKFSSDPLPCVTRYRPGYSTFQMRPCDSAPALFSENRCDSTLISLPSRYSAFQTLLIVVLTFIMQSLFRCQIYPLYGTFLSQRPSILPFLH